MNVFEFRDRVIAEYSAHTRSFISIRDERIRERVETDLEAGLLLPEPRIGLNPAFAEGAWIDCGPDLMCMLKNPCGSDIRACR